MSTLLPSDHVVAAAALAMTVVAVERRDNIAVARDAPVGAVLRQAKSRADAIAVTDLPDPVAAHNTKNLLGLLTIWLTADHCLGLQWS